MAAGAERLLQDAVEAGTPVGLIAGTCSVPDEAVVSGALKALGDELAPRVHVFTNALDNAGDSAEAGTGSKRGDGDGTTSAGSFEHSMAAARAQVLAFSRALRCAVCILPSLQELGDKEKLPVMQLIMKSKS